MLEYMYNKINMQNYKQKEYVRIIGNTTCHEHGGMNNMVGKIYQVNARFYDEGQIWVWFDKKNGIKYLFNTSDTQKVFINDIKEDGTMDGCVKDGYAIGENDVIEWNGRNIAYDFYLGDNKKWVVRVYKENDEDDTYYFRMHESFKVTPKYPITQKETITIGGRKYSKDDVENALKNIKEIK